MNQANPSAMSQAMSPQHPSSKHRSQYVAPESAKANQPRRNPIEGVPAAQEQILRNAEALSSTNVAQREGKQPPLLLNQAQIIYANESPLKSGASGMVVRIDNSSNQQHVITKKKWRSSKEAPQASGSDQGTCEDEPVQDLQLQLVQAKPGDQDLIDPQLAPIVFDNSQDQDTNLRVEIRSLSHAADMVMPPGLALKSQQAGSALNTASNGATTLSVNGAENQAEIDSQRQLLTSCENRSNFKTTRQVEQSECWPFETHSRILYKIPLKQLETVQL